LRRDSIYNGKISIVFDKKITILRVLLDLQNISALNRSKTFDRKGDILSLPSSLRLVKQLLAKRRFESPSAMGYRINRDTLSLTSISQSRAPDEYRTICARTGSNQMYANEKDAFNCQPSIAFGGKLST